MKHKKLLFITAFVIICIVAICIITSIFKKQPDDNQSDKPVNEDTSVIMTQEDDLEILPEVDTTVEDNTTSNYEDESSADVEDNTEAPTLLETEDEQHDSTAPQESETEERIELPFVPAQ